MTAYTIAAAPSHVSTPRLLLGGMAALAVGIGLGRFAFTPILPVMQAEHHFGSQLAGWLAAANNVGYLIGALWAGWVSGDAQRHRLLGLGFVLLILCLGGMGLTDDPWLWGGLRLVGGVASAWVFVLASALVIPLLTQSGHGRWNGLHFGGVGLGIILAGLFIGWAASHWGGAWGWWVTGGLALLLSAISWPILQQAHPRTGGGAASSVTVQPDTYPLAFVSAAYFAEGLGYIVTGTFLVSIVKSTDGLQDYANLSWVLVGLAALPSSTAWALLAERRGYLSVLIAAHVIQAVGVAIPALSNHPAAVLLGAVMYGGTFLGIVGMSLAFGRTITPDNPARTIGLLTASFGVGQILGPVLAAWLAQTGGWSFALLSAAFTILLGAVLLLWGRAFRTRKA